MSGRRRDLVFVRGLALRAVVGVHPRERLAPQRLTIDVELACDAAAPARRDDLRLAVDYAAVARAVERYVAAHRPRLLETLAEGLAGLLRRRFRSPWVRLRLTKPAAVPAADGAGVLIERGERPAP